MVLPYKPNLIWREVDKNANKSQQRGVTGNRAVFGRSLQQRRTLAGGARRGEGDQDTEVGGRERKGYEVMGEEGIVG